MPRVTLKYIHRLEVEGWGWRVHVKRHRRSRANPWSDPQFEGCGRRESRGSSRTGRIYEKYRASWTDESGEVRRRTFAIDRYGEREAMRRAGESRRAVVAAADEARHMRQPIVARQLPGAVSGMFRDFSWLSFPVT